jgi:hypothetical protein
MDVGDWTVHVKVTEPAVFDVDVAVTVTWEVPAVVGVPEMSPEELMLSPAGSPVAV